MTPAANRTKQHQETAERVRELVARWDWDRIWADPRAALADAEAIVPACRLPFDATLLGHAHVIAGTAQGHLGDYALSKTSHLAAIECFRASADDAGRCLALLRINIPLYHLGEIAAGTSGLSEALTIAQRLGDRTLESQIHNDIATAYADMGEYDQAIESMSLAVEGARATGDAGMLVFGLTNISKLYREVGSADRSEPWLIEALAVSSKHDESMQLLPLAQLAVVLRDVGRFEEARARAEQALVIARRTGNTHFEATALLAIAEDHFRLGDTAAATELAGAAQRIQAHSNMNSGWAAALLSEWSFTKSALNPTDLRDRLALAERRVQSDYELPLACSIAEALANLHERCGDFAAATAQLWRLIELRNRHWNQRKRGEAQRLAIQFELSKAQTDSERERQRSEQLVRANLALAGAHRHAENLVLEVQQQARQLERLSTEDPLTGLFNRRHLNHLFAQEQARADEIRHPLCVALADLDHFKQVNDRFGHNAGDAVLVEVAKLLRSTLRNHDIVARFGGEEFAIVMPETPLTGASIAMENVRRAIRDHDWTSIHPDLDVSISIGIAEALPGVSRDRTLSDADIALYTAKHAGRDRVCSGASCRCGSTRHALDGEATEPRAIFSTSFTDPAAALDATTRAVAAGAQNRCFTHEE